MKNLDHDWFILNSAANELQDYLLSAEIYWPVSAKGTVGKISLTPGTLLLSLKRVNSTISTPGKREEFSILAAQILNMRKRWRANWVKKAQKEYFQRVQLWKNYLSDLKGDILEHAPFYAQQVHLRTIAHLLHQDLDHNGQDETLSALDEDLRQISKPGPFVWDSELEKGFSSSEYWFLFLSF